uniref:Uncharacterized protein n=1 Tax=Oryza brachyantha TaxID=4533 RepID=J3N1H3_ORYBR
MTGLSDDESWGDPRWRRRMGGQGRHTTKPRNMDGNGSGWVPIPVGKIAIPTGEERASTVAHVPVAVAERKKRHREEGECSPAMRRMAARSEVETKVVTAIGGVVQQ